MSDSGPVETTMRALVGSLGDLSARQAVTAEQAIAVASRLDREPDGSKASALSRELRMLVGLVLPTSARDAGGHGASGDGNPDPVAAVVRSLADKRRQRRRAAG